MAMEILNLTNFSLDTHFLEESQWLLVVKSQDQSIRRERLLKTLKGGRIGRTETRPTATGLLAKVILKHGKVDVVWTKEFPEPRHIVRVDEKTLALTDVNGVNLITEDGCVESRITDELFAFLHSIDVMDGDRKTILVSSSGYDAVLEIDLCSMKRTFLWSAWAHGFNPDEDGNWLALTEDEYENLLRSGKRAVFVNPALYGEQGINTKFRSAHPNVAVYNRYKDCRTIIVSIGHEGGLYEVDRLTKNTELIFDKLSQMPHGLWPYNGGWIVSNTTKGEMWFLSRDFILERKVVLSDLGGKPKGVGPVEWLQNTKIVSGDVFLCLDANRGLIAVDIEKKKYNIYQPNVEWCIQDAFQL